ncbi:MAG: RNA 3'-terminal phosphate cyclase [Myxococcales bacterium]|nr:RNA 3'-terminal phosphate cyclase [Polyangiaceae bacterium]MDW8249008.1 RNA 3'-terminal phosphate cyclase [Myxococcales bacterium]
MLHLDGRSGEGGGQILRTALSLALVTGQSFHLSAIRARRRTPGLLRQHLTAVQAAARIGSASIEGAELGSTELIFRPGSIQGGEHRFAIGTAGSATLVFQTILPALLRASVPSQVQIEGGTHNPMAPSFDFLERAFLPLLRRMGAEVRGELQSWGFYPAGGGQITFHVEPWTDPHPLLLQERGKHRCTWAMAAYAGLPFAVAERELSVVGRTLGIEATALRPLVVRNSRGPGNALLVGIEHEHITELIVALGEKGKLAERVAEEAVEETRSYLAHGAPVGEHLADQLLLPLALGRGGVYRTGPLSLHTRTQIETIQRFLDVSIRVREVNDTVREIEVNPR